MSPLEHEAIQIVRDMVRVAASPAALFEEDGVDELLFAARIEGLVERECAAAQAYALSNPGRVLHEMETRQ